MSHEKKKTPYYFPWESWFFILILISWLMKSSPLFTGQDFIPEKKSPKQPVVYPKMEVRFPKKTLYLYQPFGPRVFFFRFGKKIPRKSPEVPWPLLWPWVGALGAPGCCWMGFLRSVFCWMKLSPLWYHLRYVWIYIYIFIDSLYVCLFSTLNVWKYNWHLCWHIVF